MSWHVTPDFDAREVFSDPLRAESVAAEIMAADDTVTCGEVAEARGGRRWFYVVVRRRGSRELVGYAAPGEAP